uniref:Uncharacterized protein n=1 Tax=Mesocestoides corti TaxID=53468 RepID=A0A5K3F1Q9_MESCO
MKSFENSLKSSKHRGENSKKSSPAITKSSWSLCCRPPWKRACPSPRRRLINLSRLLLMARQYRETKFKLSFLPTICLSALFKSFKE